MQLKIFKKLPFGNKWRRPRALQNLKDLHKSKNSVVLQLVFALIVGFA